jgi:hypothetical protein
VQNAVSFVDDHETASLVMQAMEAVEHQSPNERAR